MFILCSALSSPPLHPFSRAKARPLIQLNWDAIFFFSPRYDHHRVDLLVNSQRGVHCVKSRKLGTYDELTQNCERLPFASLGDFCITRVKTFYTVP